MKARIAALVLISSAAVAVDCSSGGAGGASTAAAPSGAPDWNNLPLKHAPQPTSAAITANDLMTRLYIFADDSMQGRQAGREGNMIGTNYIARELTRLNIEPAGDNGTYFQALPYVQRHFLATSTLSADGKPLRWLTDFVATPTASAPQPIGGEIGK